MVLLRVYCTYTFRHVPTSLISTQERKVDLLRTLFDSSWEYGNDVDAKVAEQYRLTWRKNCQSK